MLAPEARWFGRQLARYGGDELQPLLNLGSQSLAFRTRVQPWLDRHVFAPLRARQIRVIHSDLQTAEGVELVGDLTDAAFRARLKTLRFRAVICSNLLEHIVNPAVIASTVVDVLEPGGLLFVSVPCRFPYHADPIDTMFRPTPAELAALFPGTSTVEQGVIGGGNLMTYTLGRLFGSPRRLISDLFGRRQKNGNERSGFDTQDLALSTHHPGPWSMLPWLIRRFEVSCLVLRKAQS